MKRVIALVFVGLFGVAVVGCAHTKNTKATTQTQDAGQPVMHPPPAQ
ncbi:MAG TPA: hypothetical protein VII38_05335 [Polyangia bacterium]|jgi:hypothetical protein